MPQRDRPLLAVLVDADNIPAKYAEAIMKEITGLGEPALRRVYGDWSGGHLRLWADKVLELGLVAHQETANTRGKNASDIGLVIDAMDILHSGRFDGFVLVSSDSDFTRLAARIREEGLDVIGIGEGKAPESLRKVCNRFIQIENLVEEPEPKSAGTAARPGKKKPQDALPLILRAMERIDQDGEWFEMGALGSQLVAEATDFDTRTYGKRKLSDLVADIKRLETKKEGPQLMVRRLD
ncbi:NYN domain-containing protein [Jannaschia seohaensis]|uniref:OST-HTH/LOTUS domain-containing protein n=1 Tax=Jannaschia seohaensis TaxID=475081 RepID=A0A2Y9A1K0_9RHOB|nr:NYN domain-containing protein [Jannaschia seohaensis]PWJ22143.1 OST-HTH/LOTUS domain-containing protein [Jannaschia seohaensis]SSA38421.1 OST-HTH/LOTUS domain-containing protein [Jannaschia seohaensis]